MRGVVFKELLERNKIASSGSGVLIKKEIFDIVGLFDENLRFAEDWDMGLRIAEKFQIDFSDKILVHIRKHEDNMTSSPLKTFANELCFYNKWISRLEEQYNVPLFWSDKITFRIISRFPSINFVKLFKETVPEENRKILFRKTLGSVYLYIPLFFLRQIFNLIFTPNYLYIFIGFIKNRGK